MGHHGSVLLTPLAAPGAVPVVPSSMGRQGNVLLTPLAAPAAVPVGPSSMGKRDSVLLTPVPVAAPAAVPVGPSPVGDEIVDSELPLTLCTGIVKQALKPCCSTVEQ